MRVFSRCLVFSSISHLNPNQTNSKPNYNIARRQDLLLGATMEIMSWGTHGGLQGQVQQLLDN